VAKGGAPLMRGPHNTTQGSNEWPRRREGVSWKKGGVSMREGGAAQARSWSVGHGRGERIG
jgi:hypothetical protein